MRSIVRVLLSLVLFVSIHGAAHAQQPVGRCIDQVRQQSFLFFGNGAFFQEGNPGNTGMAIRDPTGLTFVRLPSSSMLQAFFVEWSGRLVEINPNGVIGIGICQFTFPAQPYVNIYQPPVRSSYWIQTPNGVAWVPQMVVQPSAPWAPPMLTSGQTAQSCWYQSGGSNGVSPDRDRFGDCMVRNMTGARERAVYDCARTSSNDRALFAFCTAGALGGANERQAAQQLSQCYRQYGTNWRQYSLCMAANNTGGEAGRLLACVQQQSATGNVTAMGTAICYGGQLLQMNTELQIAVECAATTGGQPYAFAGCAGGRLTARELDKCFSDGVGGPSGCFGDNNEIVRALNAAGLNLQNICGPNNIAVRTFNNAVNDVQNGPGPNNFVRQTLANAASDITNGPGPNNDARKIINQVIPGLNW